MVWVLLTPFRNDLLNLGLQGCHTRFQALNIYRRLLVSLFVVDIENLLLEVFTGMLPQLHVQGFICILDLQSGTHGLQMMMEFQVFLEVSWVSSACFLGDEAGLRDIVCLEEFRDSSVVGSSHEK